MLIQISSGQGPKECQYFVWLLYQNLKDEFGDIRLVTTFPNDPDSIHGIYRSLIFDTDLDLSYLCGTMQWIWKSKFRPRHKRKNWFVDVSEIPEVENMDLEHERHITIRTCRSGGPGGQNVNKTETAVEIIDEETGIRVTSSEERSQYANKKRAMNKLSAILEMINTDNKARQKNDAWRRHTQIERGNPIRVYEGDWCKLKTN